MLAPTEIGLPDPRTTTTKWKFITAKRASPKKKKTKKNIDGVYYLFRATRLHRSRQR